MLSHHDSRKGITPSNKDKQVKKSRGGIAEQLAEDSLQDHRKAIEGTKQDIPVKASDGTNITEERAK